MSDRLRALMASAADALEDGRDPFSDAFLSEHSVTLSEVYDLSEALATGARLWLDVQSEIREGGVRAHVVAMAVGRSLTHARAHKAHRRRT